MWSGIGAQEEVEFPNGDGDYEVEYVDINQVNDDSLDYVEKNYDYVLEKDPVKDIIEDSEDIIEDLDSVAMDDGVTLTLSDVKTTTTTTPASLPKRNVFITLVIGK